MGSRTDGEWWLDGRPLDSDGSSADLPPGWRPMPLAAVLIVFAVATAATILALRTAAGAWDHVQVFVIAAALPEGLLLVGRAVTGRRPVNAQVVADHPARLWLLGTPLFAGAIAYPAGIPPEDALLAAIPLIFVADEVLLSSGLARPRDLA